MVIDKILDALKTAPGRTETPGQLARLGFLEWMWSLSDDDDFAEQAAAADATLRQAVRPHRRFWRFAPA